MGDDMGGMGSGGNGGAGADSSLTGAARRATRLQLPGMGRSNTRSLFIFSEDNFIRKYAQIIIEGGYPFEFRFKLCRAMRASCIYIDDVL